MFNKKGLSPLIATMLLIAFAVSLGVVIITILNFLIVPNNCATVHLTQVSPYPAICYSINKNTKMRTYSIQLRYDNTDGSTLLKKVTINFRGKRKTESLVLPPILKNNKPETISPGQFIEIDNLKFPEQEYGQLVSVAIIPTIMKGNSISSCSADTGYAGLEIDARNIKKCSS